jgi:hypothetical protein
LDLGAAEQLIKLVVEVVVPFSEGPFLTSRTYLVRFERLVVLELTKKPSKEVKK